MAMKTMAACFVYLDTNAQSFSLKVGGGGGGGMAEKKEMCILWTKN